MSAMKLLILPGDGIGPEVMAEVRKAIDWLVANRGLDSRHKFVVQEWRLVRVRLKCSILWIGMDRYG